MDRCESCRHWEFDQQEQMGVCACPKLGERWHVDRSSGDMLAYEYDEGGQIFTGPRFGCVHHEPIGNLDCISTTHFDFKFDKDSMSLQINSGSQIITTVPLSEELIADDDIGIRYVRARLADKGIDTIVDRIAVSCWEAIPPELKRGRQ